MRLFIISWMKAENRVKIEELEIDKCRLLMMMIEIDSFEMGLLSPSMFSCSSKWLPGKGNSLLNTVSQLNYELKFSGILL